MFCHTDFQQRIIKSKMVLIFDKLMKRKRKGYKYILDETVAKTNRFVFHTFYI